MLVPLYYIKSRYTFGQKKKPPFGGLDGDYQYRYNTYMAEEDQSKVCTECGVDKPVDEFHRHKKGRLGRQEKCKPCKSATDKKYYAENRHKVLRGVKKYQKENPDKVKETQHRKYMKSRDRIIAKNQEWTNNNRDKRREYSIRYARKRYGLLKDAGPVDYEAVLDRDGYVCYLCGGGIDSPKNMHYDHIIPVTRGGPHSEDNISVTHASCNISKQNKLPEELPESLEKAVKAKLDELL